MEHASKERTVLRLYGQMIGETLRALAVLALLFLSFGHQPIAVSPAADTLSLATIATSWCGGPVSDEDRGHAPCHACRIAGSALPPPEGGLLHLPQAGRQVIESRPIDCGVAALIPGLFDARGPPRLV